MLTRLTALCRVPASFHAYRRLLAEPGALRAVTGAALASIPIAVLGLTLLLLVQQQTGRLSEATLVSAASGAGTAVSIVVQGQLLDRFGPRRVLRPLAIAQLVLLAGLVLTVQARAPLAVLTVLACCAGGCEPHVAGSLRGLWGFAAPARRVEGLALTSTVFEAAVVTGPALLAGLLALTSPAAAVLAWGACFGAGTVLLTSSGIAAAWRPTAPEPVAGRVRPAKQSASEPAGQIRRQRGRRSCGRGRGRGRGRRRGRRDGRLGPLAVPQVRQVVVVSAMQAAALAFVQVAAIVTCQAAGRADLVPWCAAAATVGSLAGTVTLALRAGRGSPLRRVRLLLVTLAGAVPMTGLLAGSSLVGLLVGLVVVGACTGPVGVSCFAVVDEALPRGQLVGGFTTVTAAGLLATAAATALAGAVAENVGANAGFLLASALTAAAVVSASLPRRAG